MISIITPTYNSADTIARTARSVIEQNYKDFEHIIVDNKSADNTINIAESLYKKSGLSGNLKIISEIDNGISDAFNKGINASKGGIIAILNSDDTYYDRTVFGHVVKEFDDPDILIVYGDILFTDSLYGTNRRAPKRCPASGAVLFNHPAMFVRKSVYDRLGLYENSYKIAMDTEFFYRMHKSFNNVQNISKYIAEMPLAVMNAGGASWKQEINGIKEMKAAMQLHGFWNLAAKKIYYSRITRTKIKKYLTLFKLNSFVKAWRRMKWGN